VRFSQRLVLAAAVVALQVVMGSAGAAASRTDLITSIPVTVVTSTGEPVVGVGLTAMDET
jgi:hypothetical protein